MKIYGNQDITGVLEIALNKAIPALLVGPTGSGKNTILRHIAEKLGRKDIIRLSLTGETTVDDLIGRVTLKDGNTVDQDGNVTHAVRNGHILVLDEVNAAQPEVLFALQSLLDDDRNLTMPNGEVVNAHKDFRAFATMNPTSGYSGTKSMNKAFLSRFGLVVNVNYISAEEEQELLNSRQPELKPDDLMVMLATAQKARHKLARDELTFPLSTRDLLNWAQMNCELKDLLASFKHTIVTKAETDGRELLDILKESVAEKNSNSEYLTSLQKSIDELVKQLSYGTTTGRSLFRVQADKAAILLEQLKEIATEQNRLKEEVLAETKQNMSAVRKQLKTAAQKLLEDSQALDAKHDTVFQSGYDKAKQEIYEKLGLPVESKA